MSKKLGKLTPISTNINRIVFTKKFNLRTINNNEYHISQTTSFNEQLMLVDENDKKVGSITKLDGKIK